MLSLSEAIESFVVVDETYQAARDERKELGAVLADYAREADATQNTVHLSSPAGQKIDVEFKTKVEYDVPLMRDVANLLGKQFDELFETVITFKPKARPLKMFMNTVTTDESKQTAKEIINQAKVETPQTPYVHTAKK